MIWRHFLIVIIVLAFGVQSNAQSGRQYIAKGNKELLDGFANSAIFYYKKALSADTFLLEANFMMGEAYRSLRNYKRAKRSYEATIDMDGEDKFPEAIYYLAEMQIHLGKYSNAKRTINSFLSVYRERDDKYRRARDLIVTCDFALDHKSDTTDYEVMDPDSGLNSVHAEMNPFALNETMMYFSTMRYETDEFKKSNPVYIEIEKSVKDTSGIWQSVELDIPISEKGAHIGNGVWSSDSTRFYYSRCESRTDCEIFQVNYSGTWSEPIRLDEPINIPGSSSTQPALAIADGREYLIFSSDRESGKGGMDLWFVEIKQGKPLSRIRNLGTRINTKGDEITPYFDDKDTALYFSSNRHAGFGGFDVFVSRGIPGNLQLIENLGPQVNGSADDYYFTFKTTDSTGYFASNRKGGLKPESNETCCNAFYKVRRVPPVIELDTVDSLEIDSLPVDTIPEVIVVTREEYIAPPESLEELQELLPISLYFHNDRPDPRTMSRSTLATYEESVDEYLTIRQEYADAISNSALAGRDKMSYGTELMNFFDRDVKGSLTRVDQALDVLLKQLELGNDISLAVKGFASPLAEAEYNLNLTYRRIASMENYIEVYRNRSFLPYLQSGQLSIEPIPYGESQAAEQVSDALDDRTRAIYSPQAAKERRIEIMRIDVSE